MQAVLNRHINQLKEMEMEPEELFRIIHFNDVYDIQPGDKDPMGGVARFKTAVDSSKTERTLVLFSGDAFSPSLLSDIHRGTQMILPLNSLGIDVACLGNHDLDFPYDESLELQRKTNFPWVLSNFFHKGTHDRLLDTKEFVILQSFGFKFGIFGLAEKEWEDTLADEYHQKLDYVDFVEYGTLLVNTLRHDHGCNFIIALTHMMGYNDTKLAQSVQGIDLILGGHDHTIRSEQIKQIPIIKSGTNFKNFSIVSVRKQKDSCAFHTPLYGVDVKLITITEQIKQDPILEEHVIQLMKDIEEDRNKVALILDADIDLRFQTIRKIQTPYLRLIAEWYYQVVDCDIVLFNSGNQRNNAIYKKGPLLKKDVLNHCQDAIVSKKVTGAQLLQILENAVSMYPNYSGRYASFAGISFVWDSTKPQKSRVIKESIQVSNQQFNENHEYVVATHQFQSVGGDGYFTFREAEFLFKPVTPLLNVNLVCLFTNPETPQAKQFARMNPEFYYIQTNEHGQKVIHFDPTKIPSIIKMI